MTQSSFSFLFSFHSRFQIVSRNHVLESSTCKCQAIWKALVEQGEWKHIGERRGGYYLNRLSVPRMRKTCKCVYNNVRFVAMIHAEFPVINWLNQTEYEHKKHEVKVPKCERRRGKSNGNWSYNLETKKRENRDMYRLVRERRLKTENQTDSEEDDVFRSIEDVKNQKTVTF